jgi:hypothetical protein
MAESPEKMQAMIVVAEAMRYCLTNAGAHITKGNMKQTIPLDAVEWRTYSRLWKRRCTKEDIWIAVGQLIEGRDKIKEALEAGDFEDAEEREAILKDYKINVVFELLTTGCKPHRK